MLSHVTRRQFVITGAAAMLARHGRSGPPAPFGAAPSPRQLAWHRLETYAFLHFTVNTFTDKEWGYGDEDPNVFNPSSFDADAIVQDLKAGGMKAVILTCKHHDGFCLWPTRTTEHSVRNSRWQNGKGDVVRDVSAAARRAGLAFGVYVSPWDRSNARYGTPAYLPLYRQQITELLTNYGPIFEVWFDGANGGDGFYGGAREKRHIDAAYYEWDSIIALIRRLQPQAVVFGEAGDIRWVGSETGVAGDPCWATLAPQRQKAQNDPHASENGGLEALAHGVRGGSLWKPAECDVSIRPGWFWHQSEDGKVKSADQLIDLYFDSVGRGASFLLNVPPNREGLLAREDAAALRRYSTELGRIFAHDLAPSATLTPSNGRGGDERFGARNLIDGDPQTYWATDNTHPQPSLTIQFATAQPIGVIRLREAIQFGQRIGAVRFDAWNGGGWHGIAAATSIGACRLIRFSQPITTEKLRLRVVEASAPAAIAEIGVFRSAL